MYSSSLSMGATFITNLILLESIVLIVFGKDTGKIVPVLKSIMTPWRRMDKEKLWLHAFLTSTLDGSECSFTPR
jgi:hypothetical protein